MDLLIVRPMRLGVIFLQSARDSTFASLGAASQFDFAQNDTGGRAGDQ